MYATRAKLCGHTAGSQAVLSPSVFAQISAAQPLDQAKAFLPSHGECPDDTMLYGHHVVDT